MSEKVTFKNSRGLKLVGILEPVKTDKIVVMAHGFTSNKDRPKFVKTAEELSKAGFATLRFDFCGSGESDIDEITVSKQVDDLKAAINYATSRGYTKIGLLGSSLGGLDIILAYDEKINTMVLLAPVTHSKTPSGIQDPDSRQEIMQKGYYILNKEGRDFKIPKEYIEEREAVKQEEMLSRIKCPVLIIHGDKDELVPLEQSKNAMKYLSKDSKLEIIPNGSHRLEEDLEKLASLTVDWCKKYLI